MTDDDDDGDDDDDRWRVTAVTMTDDGDDDDGIFYTVCLYYISICY